MATKLTLELNIKTDLKGLKELQRETEAVAASLRSEYSQALEEAAAALDSSLTFAARQIEATGAHLQETIFSTLQGAFSSAIRGDLDKAEGLLESFGKRMEASFRGLGERLAGGLLEQLYQGLEQLAQRFIFAPLENLLGELGNSLMATLGNWAGSLGSILASGTHQLSRIASGADWTSLLAPVTGRLADRQVVNIAGSSLAAGASSIAGDWLGINAEIEAAQIGVGTSGMGIAGALGAGLGMIGGLEGFAALTGIKSPTQALFDAVGEIFGFGGEQGYTPAQALAELNARMGFFLRQIERLGTLDLSAAGELASRLEMLAEKAGMGKEGLKRLVDTLQPLQGRLVEAGEAMGVVNTKIERLVEEAQRLETEMSSTVSGAEMLRERLVEMAGAMGLPEAEAKELRQAIDELVDAWQRGDMSAASLAEALRGHFAKALEQLAHSAGTTVGQMRALAEAIRAIPTHWESEIAVRVRSGTGFTQGPVMHEGGLVRSWPRYHSGALVGSLGADEVPIIARRGEFVVRAESVGPQTLPWLEALNRTGKVPTQGPMVVVNAPLVEVKGHALTGEEGVEELARIIEEKLAELAESRIRPYM